MLTEVYYPTLNVPNVQTLQLIVVTPEGKIETESEDSTHSIKITDQSALSFEQENKASSGAYVVYKRYVTDPERETLIVQVSFRGWEDRSGGYSLYVCYDPSLNNSGMHDSAWTQNDALIAADGDKASALISSPSLSLRGGPCIRSHAS